MRRRGLIVLALLLRAAWGQGGGAGEVKLVTDEAIPRYLARGRELAAGQQWEKAADLYQRVIAGDATIFPELSPDTLHAAVHSEDGTLFIPAREICMRELAQMPPEGLKAYRAACDEKAAALLGEARRAPGVARRLAALAAVYDLYLVSSSGDDALEMAADLHFDLGRYREALLLYRRLLEVYPSDTDRPVPLLLAKAAYCAARVGDTARRDAFLARAAADNSRAQILVAGVPVSVQALRDHPALQPGDAKPAARSGDWPMAGGNPERNRLIADIPEGSLPAKPLWSALLAEGDLRFVADDRGWRIALHSREEASPGEGGYPTLLPILLDGVLWMKDYNEVVARSAGSGTLRRDTYHLRGRLLDRSAGVARPDWKYPRQQVRPGPPDRAEALITWYDVGGSALVSDSESLFGLWSAALPRFADGEGRGPAIARNCLLAWNRSAARLRWGFGRLGGGEDSGLLYSAIVARDPRALNAWRVDYENHSRSRFLGPGVVADGILYTLAAEESGIALWAFHAAEGRVLFRTLLHLPDTARSMLPVGAPLAAGGGAVYAVSSGVVACVEAQAPGRVRWIRRYPRAVETSEGDVSVTSVQQTFGYNDPLLDGGRLYVAAPDATGLFALDAETGALSWHVPCKEQCLVGVSQGVVVVAGFVVRGLDARTGKQLWEGTLRGDRDGRGLLSATTAYIPTRASRLEQSWIQRFDLKTGEQRDPFAFATPRLGNLLYTDGRLVVANERGVACFSTAQAERERIDARLAARPDPDLWIERGMLAMAEGNRRAARDDLARAIEAAHTGHLDDREPRIRAFENLVALAGETGDRALCAEARQLAPNRFYAAQADLLEFRLLLDKAQLDEAMARFEKIAAETPPADVVLDAEVLPAPRAAERLLRTAGEKNPALKAALEERVRRLIDEAAQKKDLETLETIPARFGFARPSEEACFRAFALHLAAGEAAAAEQSLRRFIRDFPDHQRRAEAHLLLARELARGGRTEEAKAELQWARQRGNDATPADLLAAVEALLPGKEEKAPGPPALTLPLGKTDFAAPQGVPVRFVGAPPPPLRGGMVLVHGAEITAVGPDGRPLWTSRRDADPPEPSDEARLSRAAEVSANSLCVALGEDLLFADAYGAIRLDARTGTERWRAAFNTRAMTLVGGTLWCVRKSLLLVDTETGRITPRQEGMVPLGAPSAAAGCVAIGFGERGLLGGYFRGQVRVDNTVGSLSFDFKALCATPVIDGAGRLLVLGNREDDPVITPLESLVYVRLAVFDSARGGQLACPDVRTVSSRASILYADADVAVIHDGGPPLPEGGNLHFVELGAQRVTRVRAPELLGAQHIVRDGDRLFVLTFDPEHSEAGARLFRIDLRGRTCLAYDHPPIAEVYAPPLLTRQCIFVAGAGPRGAFLRAYEREALAGDQPPGPYPVFRAGGDVSPLFDLAAGSAVNYEMAPALALCGNGLWFSSPFGCVFLAAENAGAR